MNTMHSLASIHVLTSAHRPAPARKTPGAVSRFVKAISGFLARSVDCVAPFTVYNIRFMKSHHCWTYKGACAWLACYDAADFGTSYVTNFHGDIIASKGI